MAEVFPLRSSSLRPIMPEPGRPAKAHLTIGDRDARHDRDMMEVDITQDDGIVAHYTPINVF
jgi:hypothetical protein